MRRAPAVRPSSWLIQILEEHMCACVIIWMDHWRVNFKGRVIIFNSNYLLSLNHAENKPRGRWDEFLLWAWMWSSGEWLKGCLNVGECMEPQMSCVHVFKYSHMARKIMGPIIMAVYSHIDMGAMVSLWLLAIYRWNFLYLPPVQWPYTPYTVTVTILLWFMYIAQLVLTFVTSWKFD